MLYQTVRKEERTTRKSACDGIGIWYILVYEDKFQFLNVIQNKKNHSVSILLLRDSYHKLLYYKMISYEVYANRTWRCI